MFIEKPMNLLFKSLKVLSLFLSTALIMYSTNTNCKPF
jgi:hypothetical protein